MSILSKSPWWALGLASLLLGGCLALMGGLLFIGTRLALSGGGVLLPIPLAPQTIEGLATVAAKPSPARADPTLWEEAEDDLNVKNEPQKVLDLLLPQLDQLTDSSDLARAYALVGKAEFQLGRFQLAAVYFEKLYGLQPTAENLFSLATAYDLGGDLRHALEKYQALAEWQGAEADLDYYKDVAQERIGFITDVLGTPTPTG